MLKKYLEDCVNYFNKKNYTPLYNGLPVETLRPIIPHAEITVNLYSNAKYLLNYYIKTGSSLYLRTRAVALLVSWQRSVLVSLQSVLKVILDLVFKNIFKLHIFLSNSVWWISDFDCGIADIGPWFTAYGLYYDVSSISIFVTLFVGFFLFFIRFYFLLYTKLKVDSGVVISEKDVSGVNFRLTPVLEDFRLYSTFAAYTARSRRKSWNLEHVIIKQNCGAEVQPVALNSESDNTFYHKISTSISNILTYVVNLQFMNIRHIVFNFIFYWEYNKFSNDRKYEYIYYVYSQLILFIKKQILYVVGLIKKDYHLTIEIIWTVLPTMVVSAVILPSLSLMYEIAHTTEVLQRTARRRLCTNLIELQEGYLNTTDTFSKFFYENVLIDYTNQNEHFPKKRYNGSITSELKNSGNAVTPDKGFSNYVDNVFALSLYEKTGVSHGNKDQTYNVDEYLSLFYNKIDLSYAQAQKHKHKLLQQTTLGVIVEANQWFWSYKIEPSDINFYLNFVNNYESHIKSNWKSSMHNVDILLQQPAKYLPHGENSQVNQYVYTKNKNILPFWLYNKSHFDGETISFDSYMLNVDKPVSQRYKLFGKKTPRLLYVDYPLVLPQDTLITFYVLSNDVIHSFALPQFLIKADAIPGRITAVKFDTKSLYGLFFGQCSEICGINHAFMPIAVMVIPQVKFNPIELTGAITKVYKYNPLFLDHSYFNKEMFLEFTYKERLYYTANVFGNQLKSSNSNLLGTISVESVLTNYLEWYTADLESIHQYRYGCSIEDGDRLRLFNSFVFFKDIVDELIQQKGLSEYHKVHIYTTFILRAFGSLSCRPIQIHTSSTDLDEIVRNKSINISTNRALKMIYLKAIEQQPCSTGTCPVTLPVESTEQQPCSTGTCPVILPMESVSDKSNYKKNGGGIPGDNSPWKWFKRIYGYFYSSVIKVIVFYHHDDFDLYCTRRGYNVHELVCVDYYGDTIEGVEFDVNETRQTVPDDLHTYKTQDFIKLIRENPRDPDILASIDHVLTHQIGYEDFEDFNQDLATIIAYKTNNFTEDFDLSKQDKQTQLIFTIFNCLVGENHFTTKSELTKAHKPYSRTLFVKKLSENPKRLRIRCVMERQHFYNVDLARKFTDANLCKKVADTNWESILEQRKDFLNKKDEYKNPSIYKDSGLPNLPTTKELYNTIKRYSWFIYNVLTFKKTRTIQDIIDAYEKDGENPFATIEYNMYGEVDEDLEFLKLKHFPGLRHTEGIYGLTADEFVDRVYVNKPDLETTRMVSGMFRQLDCGTIAGLRNMTVCNMYNETSGFREVKPIENYNSDIKILMVCYRYVVDVLHVNNIQDFLAAGEWKDVRLPIDDEIREQKRFRCVHERKIQGVAEHVNKTVHYDYLVHNNNKFKKEAEARITRHHRIEEAIKNGISIEEIDAQPKVSFWQKIRNVYNEMVKFNATKPSERRVEKPKTEISKFRKRGSR